MARKPKNTGKPGDFNGADPASFDHDANGAAGGSKKALGALGQHEVAALGREAFEAYDYQGERVRYDSRGRKWTFRVDKVPPGHSVLSLILSRLDEERSDTIATSVLASELGEPMCVDVVAALSEALA